MSEVIVPLLKRGGQVEKKSALVLRLGGEGGQQGQQREEGGRKGEKDVTGGELEAHLKVGGLKAMVDDE